MATLTETLPSREWFAAYVAKLEPDAVLRVLDSLAENAPERAMILATIAGADFEDGTCPLPPGLNCGGSDQGTGWHSGGLPSEICNCECHL